MISTIQMIMGIIIIFASFVLSIDSWLQLSMIVIGVIAVIFGIINMINEKSKTNKT